MARLAPGKRSNAGVAISANGVVAWMARGDGSTGEEWSRSITPMQPTESAWEDLEIALRALAADSGSTGSLFIALLPPLIQIRSIQLPPVDALDATRLVQRGAAKYFVGAREPQVVSVIAREGEKGQGTQALACAAPARVVQAIKSAAEAAGWKVARIIPAQSAWLTAADHVFSKSDALVDHGRVVVIDADRTEIIFKRFGRAESFRHLTGAGNSGAKVLEVIASQQGDATAAEQRTSRNGLRPVAIIGDDATRKQFAPALRDRGLLPLEPEGVYHRVMSSPALAAAHFAPLTEDLELVTEEARSNKEQNLQKLAVVLGGVAALFFLGGLGVQYWGLKNEKALLDARRDSVRVAVNQVIDTQNKIGSLGKPISGLDSVRAQTVRWSMVLSDIAQHLPKDAFITYVKAKGDTVVLQSKAKDAGEALQGLRRAPSLRDVQQAGQIRRELDTATFDVSALVRRANGGEGGR